MNSRSKPSEIHKEAFSKARESLGLSVKDLAGKACLSVRQIEQIEGGEITSFYSAHIKLTAAKKVADILGLNDAEAFEYFESVIPTKNEVTAKVVNQAHEASTKKLSVTEDVKSAQVQSSINGEKLQTGDAQSKGGYPKTAAKKSLLVWGGLIASMIFLGLNLRPLFFKEQPEEIIVVKEEAIEPPVEVPADSKDASGSPVSAAVPVAVPASVPTTNTSINIESCPSADAVIPSYKPASPRKAGDMVYMQAKNKQVVCVIDRSGKSQSKTIEPGLGTSFYGTPPFKVLTSDLGQVDIYFQGAKVRPENSAGKTILLEAGDLNQPAAPLDSQLR